MAQSDFLLFSHSSLSFSRSDLVVHLHSWRAGLRRDGGRQRAGGRIGRVVSAASSPSSAGSGRVAAGSVPFRYRQERLPQEPAGERGAVRRRSVGRPQPGGHRPDGPTARGVAANCCSH